VIEKFYTKMEKYFFELKGFPFLFYYHHNIIIGISI